jgi:release factor glutamine methyltransferase
VTIKQAISFGRNALAETSPSPLTDSKILIQHVLGIDRTELTRRLGQILTDGQFREFQTYLSKRQKNEPIAYITGHKEFYGIDFYVDRRVLIPRPETEQLVEAVLSELGSRGVEPTLFIDIGTGSGNIACAVARLTPMLPVIATDVSKDAVLVAKRNARNIGVAGQIDFRVGSLLEPVTSDDVAGRAVVMAANLPYVPARYQVMPDLMYEPAGAIFAGEEGVEVYHEFFRTLTALPTQDLTLFIEIHHDQGPAIRGIVSEALPGAKVLVTADYSGHDRIAKIEHRRLPLA